MKEPNANRVVMRPSWQHLLFLHWETEADALRSLLPPGLELDLYDGRAYIGFIPFTMTDVRPHSLLRLAPGHHKIANFHEANVRTYVRCGSEIGVWFFSLDAASWHAVLAARLWFHLPYFWARMSLHRQQKTFTYRSRRLYPRSLRAQCQVRYTPQGEAAPAAIGSLEHFLVERYNLYSFKRGQLFSGRVQHEPYQIQDVKLHSLYENCIAAAGIARPDTLPHACYARRVDTTIYPLQRVG